MTNNYILFSVYHEFLRTPSENRKYHADTKSILGFKGISFKEFQGNYYGFFEKSLLVNYKHFRTILELTRLAEQESILILGEATDLTKVPTKKYYINSNKIESFGYLTKCSKEDAFKNNNYTYDYTENEYFINR